MQEYMTDSTKITTLFLDIGGVLLTNGWDRHARQRAVNKFDLNYDEVNERHHLTFDTCEEGKLSLDKYLDRVIFFEDRSFSRDEFRKFMFAQSKPHKTMIGYIRQLKQTYGLKITAVSNEGRELNDYRIQTFKLNEFIDAFISSSFVHYCKPDEDIFRMALDVSQVQPEQVIYTDDREFFVQAASDLGINGIYHTSFETTRADLEEYGFKVGDL